MTIRRHRAGELVIEQTRDLARVRKLLARAGMMTAGIEWPAACYIVAYVGDEAVGMIGVESKIDAALIRSLYVDESMRRRGIGGALVAAARKAAHTRGARHLYLFSTDAGEFFARHG
ncbi:MAG: GNAT family N-acetyltransferase, partial [Candidatus Binatus sp.]